VKKAPSKRSQRRYAGPDEIRPALALARKSGKPSLVNFMLDPNVYSSGCPQPDDVSLIRGNP
jgi:hypothetical protein